MADPTVSASNSAASTTAARSPSEGAPSEAQLDQMRGGTVSPADAKASQQLDAAAIKKYLDMTNAFSQQMQKTMDLDKDAVKKIRNINAG